MQEMSGWVVQMLRDGASILLYRADLSFNQIQGKELSQIMVIYYNFPMWFISLQSTFFKEFWIVDTVVSVSRLRVNVLFINWKGRGKCQILPVWVFMFFRNPFKINVFWCE